MKKTLLPFVRENPYVWWGLFLPCYLAAFFTVEHFITDHYWATQTAIDQYIPFCEYFAPLYVSWSPVLLVLGLYLLIKDPEGFRRYIWMLILTFGTATLFCALVPNGQDLRPAVMPRENLCSALVAYTYSLDTNTNVFPSVHVLGVVSIWCALWRTPGLKKWYWRLAAAVWGCLVIASTLLIKQHAFIDVAAALPWGALGGFIVYGLIGKKRDREGKVYGRGAEKSAV